MCKSFPDGIRYLCQQQDCYIVQFFVSLLHDQHILDNIHDKFSVYVANSEKSDL